MMKIWITSLVVASTLMVQAQNKTNHLLEFLDVGKPVKAEYVQVEPDASMKLFATVINKARLADPKWFAEHEKTGTAGTPLPYHEKLMTKDEYANYLGSWDKRKIVPVKGKNGQPIRMSVLLTKETNGTYVVNVTDVPISLLEYSTEANAFKSMLGQLTFLEKIDAPKESSLRAWSGYEWRYLQEEKRYTTKENFAIGRTADQKFGYLIYRMQQIVGNQYVTDKRYVLRFAPVKKAKK